MPCVGTAQGLQPARPPPRRLRHDRIGGNLEGGAVRAARRPERQADRSCSLTTRPAAPSTTPHVDVLVVGAGLSGIGAGHYLQTECPWASYAIFEARDAIGGTWDLFRYPGIRSDSDMHTLGYSFRPWDRREVDRRRRTPSSATSRTRPPRPGIDAHIRFGHRVARGRLVERRVALARHGRRSGPTPARRSTSRPGSSSRAAATTATTTATCPSSPAWTTSPGTVVHPQAWPEDLDYAGKRIVVIGSGATAVTLVPALARSAAHVTMLQRSPTYIASLPEKSPVVALLRRLLPAKQAGVAAKWFHALTTQAFYQVSRRYPQLVKRLLRKGLERQLPPGYDIGTHFTPQYNPWDQRFCVVPERRPLHVHPRGDVLGGHRPHRALHRDGAPARPRAITSTPTSSSRPPASSCCSSAASRSAWTGSPSTRPPGSPTRG